jgi:aspartyl/asparaginyl beta-hydroxylase (cupin superfamily)
MNFDVHVFGKGFHRFVQQEMDWFTLPSTDFFCSASGIPHIFTAKALPSVGGISYYPISD